MCTGVTKGLAKRKFSGSVNILGVNRIIDVNRVKAMINPNISFLEQYVWKGTRSLLQLIPKGLLDPVWCKNTRCKNTTAATIKGNTKWIAKNRLRVALSTANPPHIHSTNIFPIQGIAENRLVITVAPQNLI